ncbi:MAG: DUF6263 family protein [Pirellulaceae bacterium]
MRKLVPFSVCRLTFRPLSMACYFAVIAITMDSIFAAATASAADPPGAKSLRWKLRDGESLRVQFSQEMVMKSSGVGEALSTEADMSMELQWRVTGTQPDGSMQMDQSIERLRMEMKTSDGESLVYDSASKEPPQGMAATIAKGLKPLIGVTFLQEMSDRGQITSIKLSPGAEEALKTAHAGAQLKDVFSQDGMRQLISEVTAVLPEKPVRVGDTWQAVNTTNSPLGPLQTETTYTYRGTVNVEQRALERIDVAMKIGFGDGQNALGLNVKVQGQHNGGSMYFDAAAGRFVQSVIKQDMTLASQLGNHTHLQQLQTTLRMQFMPAGLPERTARAK